MYIYILTNTVTGGQYVGRTTQENPCKRINEHFSKKESAVGAAINAYGADAFQVQVIAYPGASPVATDAIEKWYIAKLNTLSPNGYNLQDGGGKSRQSEETKRKISNSRKGQRPSKETRMRMSRSREGNTNAAGNTNRLGIPHTERSRRQMSLAKKGNTNASGKRSAQARANISASKRGNQYRLRQDLNNAEIKRLYDKLGSYKKVADVLNCSPSTVQWRLLQSTKE